MLAMGDAVVVVVEVAEKIAKRVSTRDEVVNRIFEVDGVKKKRNTIVFKVVLLQRRSASCGMAKVGRNGMEWNGMEWRQ